MSRTQRSVSLSSAEAEYYGVLPALAFKKFSVSITKMPTSFLTQAHQQPRQMQTIPDVEE